MNENLLTNLIILPKVVSLILAIDHLFYTVGQDIEILVFKYLVYIFGVREDSNSMDIISFEE
jgi:hypothetical protein